MSEIELQMHFLNDCKTLGELGIQALAYMMDEQRLDDKWEAPLSRRLKWVSGFEWTLEESASLIGVTRERMRQVQKKIESASLNLPYPPKLIYKVLKVAESSKNISSFWDSLKAEGLNGPEEAWEKDSLVELFSVVGNQKTLNELSQQFRRLSPPPKSKLTEKIIRDLRISILGTINIAEASSATGLTKDDVYEVIRSLYKHVYGTHDIVLAIQKPPAGFVSTITKQLEVNPVTPMDTLYEGIRRLMSYRGETKKFTFTEFEELTRDLFGLPVSMANLPQDLATDSALSEYEVVFVNAFRSLQRTILHRDELTEAAVKHGLSAQSAGVYLSTSPIIRSAPARRGYFRLV